MRFVLLTLDHKFARAWCISRCVWWAKLQQHRVGPWCADCGLRQWQWKRLLAGQKQVIFFFLSHFIFLIKACCCCSDGTFFFFDWESRGATLLMRTDFLPKRAKCVNCVFLQLGRRLGWRGIHQDEQEQAQPVWSCYCRQLPPGLNRWGRHFPSISPSTLSNQPSANMSICLLPSCYFWLFFFIYVCLTCRYRTPER